MSIKISPIEVRYKDRKWEPPRAEDVGVIRMFQDETTFEVAFDVSGYNSKELKVKVHNNDLQIICTPSDRPDAPPTATTRSCALPSEIDLSTIKSTMTTGVLEIKARKF